MTLEKLIKVLEERNIPKDVEIMSDSGWECGPSEIDMVYYNPETKILMLTRRWGNYHTYKKDDDWMLIYRVK